MYHPYPGGSAMPDPSRQPAPPSIVTACRAMYAGMAASLIGIGVDFAFFSSVKSAIEKQTPKLTPAQVVSAEHEEIGLIIASGLIQAALWLWMAQSSRAGKGWARIVASALFAIFTLGQLTGFLSSSGPSRIYSLLVWLIGLTAIVFLWQRSSTEFLRTSREAPPATRGRPASRGRRPTSRDR
jgi:hypothetical protein